MSEKDMSERLREIARRLLERTKEGRQRWEETADEARFQTSLPGYSISIYTTVMRRMFGIALLNENGRIIESLDASSGDPAREDLQALHEMARREALAVNDALDDVLDHLK